MKATEITFKELKEKYSENEAFVILGCGGSIEEWINGITELLYEEGAVTHNDPDKVWEGAYTTSTTGGRIDLILMFPDKAADAIDVGRLAILRLQMHEDYPNSWLSDYYSNYSTHHK